MAYIPRFYKLQQPTIFDYSSIRKNYFSIKAQNGDAAANLNAGGNITFSYEGQKKMYRLADPESGFFVKIGFRTKIGNNRNSNANITLANGWFGHMFTSARFRLGTQELENINDIGVVMELLQHLSGDEYRRMAGEDSGFIPDAGSGQADRLLVSNAEVTRTADQITARTTVPANVSSNNNNYNAGFEQRMKKYNYTIAGNDEHRYVTAFIPLSTIFGCCEEDKLLKSINFEINLTRKPVTEFHEVFFGADGTRIEFGDPATTGLLSMTLQLVEYIPNPNLAPEVNKAFGSPLNWTFKQRHCINRSSAADTIDISETKQAVPQYLFIVAKGTNDEAQQHGNVTRNYSLCRHCNMHSITLDLDGERYPSDPQNANFLENNYSAFYQQFKRACRVLKGTECAISSSEYRDLYTIFAIDCSCKPLKNRNAASNLILTLTRNAVGDNANPINPLNVKYFILSLNERSYSIDCVNGVVSEDK